MSAPAGTEVGLYVDLETVVAIGDVIETQTGRRYSVTRVRVQLRGAHVGRQHLRAIVLGPDVVAHGDLVVHRIRWYRRARKKLRTRGPRKAPR